MKRTHIFIPEPVQAKLKQLSDKLDINVSELIRRAIDEFLKRNKL